MADSTFIERARKIGIESFWYKETDETTIVDVMERTMAGESVYPSVMHVQLGRIDSSEITGRELEVLREITTGASNAMVADRLGITEGTVKVHVRNLLRKTGYSGRTELAIKARTLGAAVISERLTPEEKNKDE